MKKIILALVVCMLFLTASLVIWNSSFYLSKVTGWSYHIFDFIACAVGLCGFLACCLVSNNDIEKVIKPSEEHSQSPYD